MHRSRIRLIVSAALLVLALLAWMGWLRTLPKPPPRTQFVMPPKFTIPTGHVYVSHRNRWNYTSIADISDDGSRVTVGLNWGSKDGSVTSEFEIWDTVANRNATAHWSDRLEGAHHSPALARFGAGASLCHARRQEIRSRWQRLGSDPRTAVKTTLERN